MTESIFPYLLLFVTIILNLIIFVSILKIKNKGQIHVVFICLIVLPLIWEVAQMVESFAYFYFNYQSMLFTYIQYVGIIFIPVLFLFTGLIFANTKINFTKKYYLLFIIPVISIIILWTNRYHGFFYTSK